MNSDGANTPPEPPIHIVRLVARILADQQSEQREDHVVPGDGVFKHRVADAIHLRDREQQQPEQDPAGGGAQPARSAARAGRRGPHRRRGRGRTPGRRRRRARRARRRARARAASVKLNPGRVRNGCGAERGASDRVGGHRAEHDEPERLGVEVAQDQLQREEHPGDRRVERRRDARGGAAGDEQPQPRLA